MSDTKPTEDLNISLEAHLIDALRPLEAITPAELSKTLSSYTCTPPPATIPYSVLQTVFKWARMTPHVLRAHSPPLDPNAYLMVSLLAGTTTSPERKLGTYVPPTDPQELEAARAAERKSITALLNALLSILGAGVAVYWAAERLRWKNEWRVLLALFAAIVVAVAEAGLYLIWQSRRAARSTSHRHTKPASRRRIVQDKKDDGPDTVEKLAIVSTSVEDVAYEGLRRRQ
ncbi:hypothetical protein H0H81_012486 [Sphagnurus paluster]|uniref:Uncharacterized protein n=1 Tax=Sphagnurus paluster TaxID=117069 RepID=A0A9P7FN43_9AGAR|nr:hypothetical protein H0H81_012486 [Sphagnurus paluster]